MLVWVSKCIPDSSLCPREIFLKVKLQFMEITIKINVVIGTWVMSLL